MNWAINEYGIASNGAKLSVECSIDQDGDLEITYESRLPMGGATSDTIFIPGAVLHELLNRAAATAKDKP